MQNRTRVGAVIGAVVLAALAAGCSTEIPGTPVPQGHSTTTPSPTANAPGGRTPVPTPSGAKPTGKEVAPGVPVSSLDTDAVDAYPVLRLIDPCALHDPQAAARVTGQELDEFMPGRTLAACDVALTGGKASYGLSTWRITATVGVDFTDAAREKYGTPEVLGGTEFYRVPPWTPTEEQRSCLFIKSFGPGTGLQLSVRRDATEPQPKTPCQVAREYLAEVGRWWKNPALRADGLTTPAFRLAAVDPCAGVVEIAKQMTSPRASLASPYECSIAPTKGSPGAAASSQVSVTLAVANDPRGALTSPGYAAVTVAGRPGTSHQQPATGPLGPTCTVSVIADDSVVVRGDATRDDAPAAMQTVTVRAGDCARATTAAESVLALVR